jgi:hypothetical protein
VTQNVLKSREKILIFTADFLKNQMIFDSVELQFCLTSGIFKPTSGLCRYRFGRVGVLSRGASQLRGA